MGNIRGKRTPLFMEGIRYLKDNRLLPRGYSHEHPTAQRTTPVGTEEDASFLGGEDTLTYRLPELPDATRVEVGLYYQTLGARYWDDLLRYQTPSIDALAEQLERADRAPVPVSEVSVDL